MRALILPFPPVVLAVLLAACGGSSGDEVSMAKPPPSSGEATGLLPFVTGNGEVRLLDAAAAQGAANPVTVDTGLAPPPAGSNCQDCFAQAETWFTGVTSGDGVSNLHASRLAYVKRGSGNDAGGAVYKVNLEKGAANVPVQISSRTDACRIVRTETTDFAAVDATAVVIERAGADHSCAADADKVVTVIRLNSAATDAGLDLPLQLGVENPLHARLGASGQVVGYVSFEAAGPESFLLVRRDAALANPVTLAALGQVSGASLERADATHLFATATPPEQAMQLYRVETNGTLSPSLYSFEGFNAGNPVQDGVHDANFLYFTDENRLLRVPLDSTSQNAAVVTTLSCADPDTCLRIENRAIDVTGGRVVFEAQDSSITVAGGVFSAAAGANDAAATVLAQNPQPSGEGPFAILQQVAGGRAYITVAYHNTPTRSTDAVRVATDGSDKVTIPSAYWAGYNRADSFSLASASAPPPATIFLARRVGRDDGTGTDTLSAVAPATATEGGVLGTVSDSASVFLSLNVNGIGRHALARVERNREGALDYDVGRVDAGVTYTGELPVLAADPVQHDIPLDGLQRLTGNLCMICL